MSEASGYQRFFAELKRRKVFQVAAVYGAAMFGVLQAADVPVPALHLEASVYANRVLALDPLSDHKLGIAGMYALLAGDAEVGEERTWCVRDFSITAIILTQHFVPRDRFDEAERAARLNPDAEALLLKLVEAARSPAGSEARARGVERVTGRQITRGRGGGIAQPAWLVLLGEPEMALDLLEESLEGPPLGLAVLWMPMYDPIRDDPRFQAIVDGLKLPE